MPVADIGLFYSEHPDGYPASFIHADANNLDCAATFKASVCCTADSPPRG